MACVDFESIAETVYETQIFPAIFERLYQRQDIKVIKQLFRILYNWVRSENIENANTIISWLQPPQALLDAAMLGMEEMMESQYTTKRTCSSYAKTNHCSLA
jgi:hypothetical protein